MVYLIPSTMGEGDASRSVTPYLTEVINKVDIFFVEREKTARRFLKTAGLTRPQNDLVIHTVDKETDTDTIFRLLQPALEGKTIGILSEAGCPGVADPGSLVVEMAHQLGIKVEPLVGPSSILLGLMASGFNGQSFTFHGYLPIDQRERSHKLKDIERTSKREKQTQIFIETPYRNKAIVEAMIKNLHPDTRLCVAVDLTTPNETVISKRIQEWKGVKVDLHKRPAIFLIQA